MREHGKKYMAAAKNRDIAINEALDPTLPRIWADERAVRQVTLNLLSNAIKFTPQGGVISIKVGWTSAGGQYLPARAYRKKKYRLFFRLLGAAVWPRRTRKRGRASAFRSSKVLSNCMAANFNFARKCAKARKRSLYSRPSGS